MAIKEKDIKILWAKAGGICSFPNCNQELICDISDNVIGEICHVIAKSKDGPRGNFSDDNFNRDSYENLLLLCPTHHAIVDSDEKLYTVETLHEIKESHENQVKEKMRKGSIWITNISQLYYINIPRISILAAMNGIELDYSMIANTSSLNELGWNLNYVLSSMGKVINDITINAMEITSTSLKSLKEGQNIQFDEKFRTKNCPYPNKLKDGSFSLTGIIDKDPHIYVKIGEYKLILGYDPIWLTTSTSFSTFCSGWVSGAGVAVIKSIDNENKLVYASPYFIGFPKNSFELPF